MQDIFNNYLQSIARKFSNTESSEMAYRTDFEILLKEIFESINVTQIDHDPKSQQGNKPDFIVKKNGIPIIYFEAKDIIIDLDKTEKSEQMSRYFGYANLVLTDYVEFRFFRNGKRYAEPIKLAETNKGKRKLKALPVNYENLKKTILDFAQSHKEPIRTGEHLSKIMGGKAQRIRDNVIQFLSVESEKNAEILRVYETIKKLLVHDLNPETFADMYAQTLVYGLFVARYHDTTSETFTRQEARDLIPKSNPLLRHFFDHIVGPNFDKRLEYIVNELCDVFTHANVQELMNQYYKIDLWGAKHDSPDPVIHFYEDFLKEYDPELRKKIGAFYTPLPVVRFIVRSVDYLLEKDFGLSSGLADTSKLSNGKHRVQILDPAAGTGTFISATIRQIYKRLKNNNQLGRWTTYVHHDLLPRLHGFELMMAPYTIAHLKLSMAFKETGFKHFNNRLGIYLTNSLEEGEVIGDLFSGFGFAESIAEESKEASKIKNDSPIMVVIGNPPYSVSSSNKGQWIQNLIKVYKEGLNEKKTNLDDDYIKFIRFAEHFIEKNKSGIVAMITNNSFIDGITHRQMRKHLLETFDDIYILDLHGNSKKKENAPDGGKDENVFDIQQGVAISIFIRKLEEKKSLAKVYHSELYGIRENKFKMLSESDINSVKWKKLDYSQKYYFFVPKDFNLDDEYSRGFKINKLFKVISSGIKNERDSICIDLSKKDLENRIDEFAKLSEVELRNKYELEDSRDWKVNNAKRDILQHLGKDLYYKTIYRPFDIRWTYYTGTSRGFIGTPNKKGMSHMMHNNLLMVFTRLNRQKSLNYFFVTNSFVDIHLLDTAGDSLNSAPLFLYYENGSHIPNLKEEIIEEIEKITGKVSPEEIFDYIYAVLHSPNYREKYKEFLKIDFPRIPFPKDKKSFNKLVSLGTELRLLHLLESPKVNKFITTYPNAGSDEVEKVTYLDKKVYINNEQYFGCVPESSWNFYIGGYQPAQKWLKDRKKRSLTNEDIEHYQKMIVALTETEKIMKEIDKIN